MNAANSVVFNVPNQVTFARLILSFVLFILIPLKFYWAALVFFLLAAGTDWFDGWYARKYKLVTQVGRILDPFCDKILICGAFIMLAVEMAPAFPWYAKITGWMAVVVVGRELLVTVLRSLVEGSGGDFSAKFAGKLKMVFQCAAVVACLLALAMKQGGTTELPAWLNLSTIVLVWLALASTIHSGYLYVWGSREVFRM